MISPLTIRTSQGSEASRDTKSEYASRAWRLGVALVLALALGLRLAGLAWGLPWVFHPDEHLYADTAARMLESGDPNPGYFKNPSLLTYLVAGGLLAARALGPLAGPFGPDQPSSAYLVARLCSALLGAGTVALMIPLGGLLLSRRAGLLAGLLLAVAFLHVRDSHYGVNDVAATFFQVVSLLFASLALRGYRLRWLILAGLAGGLATSTKYNLGFFFVPVVAATVLSETRAARPARRAAGLAAAGCAALLAYLAGTPYTLLDLPRFWVDFQDQYAYGNVRWLGQPLEPVPLLYLTALLQGLGALPLALAGLGAAMLARARPAVAVVLGAFPLVYLAFLLPKALFFVRFCVPLLPALCLFAAAGLDALWARLIGPRAGWAGALRPAALGLLLLAVGQPLAFSLWHNHLLGQADTRILASEWVQANLPPGSSIKAEDYALTDLSLREGLYQGRTYTPNRASLRLERFRIGPDTNHYRRFAERGVQFLAVDSYTEGLYALDPPLEHEREAAGHLARLHRSLEQLGDPILRLAPGTGGREPPFSESDMMSPFWTLLSVERPGPTVRIYALAPASSRR